MNQLLNIDHVQKFMADDEKIITTCSSNEYRAYLTCNVITKTTMIIYVLKEDRLMIKEIIDYIPDVIGMFIAPQSYSLIVQNLDGVQEIQRSWHHDIFDQHEDLYKNVSVMKKMAPGTRLIIMHEGKVVSDREIENEDVDKYLDETMIH